MDAAPTPGPNDSATPAEDAETPAAPDWSLRPATLGGLALTVIIACCVVGAYVVHAQLPANAVTLPRESAVRQPAREFLPQGWAFFTRNPRESDFVPFARDRRGRWRRVLRAPHAEPRNLFGLDRTSRAQGVEMGLLQGRLRNADWHTCTAPAATCLQPLRAIPVRNTARHPTLCGQVGLAQQVPIPWAWSHAAAITMPSKVARLAVTC